MAQSTNNTATQNGTPNPKRYLIQLEGHDDMAVRDSAWYSDNKDKLFAKYPNAQIFEMSDYDENDSRDTDQYLISIDGYNDTAVRDSKWYNEKKDALQSKYGSSAHVRRVRHVDYWGDKAVSDEGAIKTTKDEIATLNNQLSGIEKGTQEYSDIEGQIASKNEYLTGLQASYDANPRVVEARAAEEEYRKKLPQDLRNRISESRKPVYVEKGDDNAKETDDPLQLEPKKSLKEIKESGKGSTRKTLLESDIESPKDMVSSMSSIESSSKQAEDILSGKTNIPVDEPTLSSAESFLDAYDYLVNNHSSIAQGAWYNIWESVSKKDYDRVHSVLQKLEDKLGSLTDISSEQIDSVLSKEEKILLEAYFMLSEEEAKTSNAFKGGEGFGESLKIGGEMLLWSAITAATGGAAAPAAATSMTVSLGKGTLKVSGKILKGLGKWALKNAGKSIAFASIAPTSHKRIAQKKLQIGDDGRLMDNTGDNLKYLAENAIEYFTEFSGEGISDGMKFIGGLTKDSKLVKAVSKIADTPVGEFSSYIWNSKGAEIMKNLQFHGMVPELLEELEGAVLNEATGLDTEAIDNFFKKDNIGITLMTLAPMTLIGAGASTVSMINTSRKMSSAELRLRTALSPELGNDRINEVVNQINTASTVSEIADVLDSVVSEIGAGNVTKQTLKLLNDYGKAAANYKTLFSGEFKNNFEVEPYVDAYTLGRSLTEEDLYDVNEAENKARQDANDYGVAEDILYQSSSDIVNYIEEHNDELTDESKNALRELAKARSIKEGLQDSLKEVADNTLANYNEIANKSATNGVLTIGMLGDKKVYIKTSREIQNGVIVAPEGVNVHMVEAIDSMTGEVILVDSKEIKSITNQNLEEYNARMANIIRDSYLQSWTDAISKKSTASKLSEVTQMVGQKVFINVDNGAITEVEIMQVLPDGQVLIKGKKGDLGGRAIQTVPIESFYDSMSRDNNGNLLSGQTANTQQPVVTTAQQSTATPAQNRDYRDGVYNIVIDGVPVEVEVTGQNDASNSVVYEYTDENGRRKSNSTTIGEFQSAIDAAAQVQTNQQSDTTPAETTNQEEIAKEEIDWDNLFETDKDGYLAELQKHFGDETLDILNEEIEAAKSELEALTKAKTKNQNERIANRGKRRDLEARVNALSEMIARLSAPVEDATAAPVEEKSAEQSSVTTDKGQALGEVVIPERTIVPLEKDPEPRNAIEFAARELGLKNGEIKLLIDSFKQHTGFGNAEAMKYVGLFRTKDKGGMTLEAAGERLMELDRENNTGFFDQTDPNAGLNAILDAIGFNGTMGELRSFTARMVQEDAQREADAAYSAWMAEYESTYGESMEDTAHRNEVLQDEYEAGYALSDEQINEYNAILAEEYNQYETENNSTENKQGETGQVSGSEDIGDLPPAEGETYESGEGGNTLLQGTQSVLDSGEGISEGAAAGSNGNNQNADTSAYGNASTGEGESVSSLEEDMPDFTQESERVPVAPNPVADPVEAAKNREEMLLSLIERKGVSDALKRDSAFNAGKEVGNFFATYEEYEAYEAEATDFGEYNEDFERGVKASFDNRPSNEHHIGEDGLLFRSADSPITPENPDIRFRKGENNTKFVEQFEFKQNNERQELEYSDEFRRLQEESARMSGQLVSEKDGVQQAAIRGLVGGIGRTLQRELDRATSGRGNKLRTVVNDSKGTSFDIIENVDGRLFHDIFEIVRTYLPNGELVDLHDNYDDAICYITSDGLAGFAVDKDGNLISVYSLYGKSKKGFLGAIKDLITEAGATHLDGYNSEKQPLAETYSKVFGWKVASMMDYNMEYDHDNIAENHGMPQVAFMVNTEADIETKHFEKDQYDEAVAYQQEQVEISQIVDAQNAAIDYLAGNARAAAIEHAVNKEAAKLGVKVTYKTRSEMPKGHQNDKGYYNTKTGEIVICTENATSIADAIQTILHEAVAHKGLRQLMGNRFNEFINRVYNSLDAETKAKVDALATAHYDGNTAVAMEEYMASLAENENFAETSVWEQIKSIFENIINSILGRNDIKIGDNELRYILRASYNNMVNPNSMNTIEGWAKDTNMRNELGINEATPEILSRTGIDDIAFTSAQEAYETVTFNGFTEIMKSIQSASGFKGKINAIKTGLLKIWNEYQMENQDAQQAVITGIEAIQKENGNLYIEDFENYLLAENQSHSVSSEEIESFKNNYFNPIIDQINTIVTSIMKGRGLDPKNKKKRPEISAELRSYMIAKHGLERNKYYQTTKGEMRDYSGLTALFGLDSTEYDEAERLAQEFVDKFEAEIGDADMNYLWNRINYATGKTLRHSYECGLISRSQYDKIKNMFNFYIPLRGFDETTAEDVYSYARFDGNSFQPAVKSTKGRTSLAFDPISVIMNMAVSEIIQGNKNRVKQALYNFVANRPNSLLSIRDCWYVLNKATGIYIEQYPDFASGETWEDFENKMQTLLATGDAVKMKKGLDIGYRFQKPANKNEHYIHLKINGVEHAIFVNGNQRLAEGVNGFNKHTNAIIEGIKKANRTASQLFTNYSYKFGGKNFFKDFVLAQTVMAIKESPAYNLRFAGNWIVNNPFTIGALMRAYKKGTLDMSKENHRLFKEFVENGGKTGYVFIDKLEKQKARIDKAVERISKYGNTKTNALIKSAILFNIIQYVNESIELATRFGTYVTSRNTKDASGNTRSIMKSIDDAKSITTNFNRKGAQSGRGLIGGLANFMGAVNFFYNAAVQGVQQIKGLNNEHPIRTKIVLGGWAGLGFAMPYIIDIFRGEDEEEVDQIYWNLPDYERKNYICIPFGNGKVTMTIPLSPVLREIYAIGVTLNDAMFNKSIDKDATMLSMECASLLSKAFIPANPVEGLSVGLTPAENLIMFGTPDIADAIVEAAINKDWTGAPLEDRAFYKEGAPHYTKVIGENNWKEIVGEKLYKKGEDNLDSSKDYPLYAWEHVLSSSVGGIGVLIKDVSNAIEWVVDWKAPERLNDIPVIRTLFSSNAMDDEKFVNNIYWDMYEVYKKKTKTIKAVYNLTEKEAYAAQIGYGEANLVKVYEAKAYPFLQRFYELNQELGSMQEAISKLPTDTETEKNDKVLAEQELFNRKRDLVYELLKYEIE